MEQGDFFLRPGKGNATVHYRQGFFRLFGLAKEGVASYELATVADDHAMDITEVVRGEDLLLSSARQCLLFDGLGWSRPDFYHCELLLDEEGRKLSKSERTLPRLFSSS